MEWITDPQIWIALATLTFLEIVLGVDNIIFISILSGKLPPEQQPRARRLGLLGAMLTRIALLFSLAWIIRLTDAVVHDRRHGDLRPRSDPDPRRPVPDREEHATRSTTSSKARTTRARPAPPPRSPACIVQIMLLDIVFSLDSVITAVGMVDELWVMVTAVMVAVAIMMVGGRADQRVRPPPSDGQDAGPQLPAPDRPVADRRRLRSPHPQGLHLLRDGLLGLRRDDQPATGGRRRRSSCTSPTATPRYHAAPETPRRQPAS